MPLCPFLNYRDALRLACPGRKDLHANTGSQEAFDHGDHLRDRITQRVWRKKMPLVVISRQGTVKVDTYPMLRCDKNRFSSRLKDYPGPWVTFMVRSALNLQWSHNLIRPL